MTERGLPPQRHPPLAIQTIVALVLLLAIAVGMFVLTDRVIENQHEQVLEQRTSEMAALVTSALGEVQSAMRVLASLTEPADHQAFDKAARALLTDRVPAIGRVDSDAAGAFVVEAGSGDVAIGDRFVGGERNELFRRSLETDGLVSGVIIDGARHLLVYALADRDRKFVVFRDATISPDQVATGVRGRVFEDLRFSIYADRRPDPDELVLTTTPKPMLSGLTIPLTVGADQWVVVAAAQGRLDGAPHPASKWIVLAFGVTVACAISALIETLARRRRYAFELVDERTTELEHALLERSRLEEAQRAARQEAEAANLAKSDFLSRMSHELRTPLNGVLGFAQLLEQEPLTESQLESVQQINKGGWHLLGLINEVLDISRIETGSIGLSPEPVLASEVLVESVDLISSFAQQHRVNLASGVMPGCDAYMYADRQRVKQVLLNLLSNAVKYNRPHGSVAVRCSRLERSLRISVTDTGPGIAAEHLGLLFQPFERLGAAHGEVEGTGIGLALSKRLAEAMGGSLAVDTTVGVGSTFHLELPLVEGPVERFVRLGTPVDPPATVAASKHKLLYIEDNLSNLRLVERLVERRGDIEIVPAMQGRLGVELARQHSPVVVLLDLHLPDIDGEEVLRQLRDDPATQHTPVVILTADATQGQVGRLLAAGAYAYLTKPLDVPAFLTLLDELMASRRD